MGRTLELIKITEASLQVGRFHNNTFLGLNLACPHFKSGNPTESFDVIVMKNLDDGSKSFAIDEFPEMRDSAIEEFWIQMVEEHRANREKVFEEWLMEANEPEFEYDANKDFNDGSKTHTSYMEMSSKALRALLSNADLPNEDQKHIQQILDDRWDQLEALEQQIASGASHDEL